MAVTRDIYSNLNLTQLLDPVVVTADANSGSVDTRGYDSVMLLANIGLSGDVLSGAVFIELEVEDSPDNSVWTDAADADLTNSVTGTNTGTFALIDAPAEDELRYIVGYKGDKRYVRVVVNVTGTHTNGTPMAVSAVQGHAHQAPVNT
ncbi:hypothetical protein LCGC14_1884040 [marine sediment metagenome]|uniref:Uncharacterized protein n=1 Tax=marine sediment metagenome TaxID=412755 RepID=A0A0F9IZP7_9ZZZZ